MLYKNAAVAFIFNGVSTVGLSAALKGRRERCKSRREQTNVDNKRQRRMQVLSNGYRVHTRWHRQRLREI